jgi:hypothetical protein
MRANDASKIAKMAKTAWSDKPLPTFRRNCLPLSLANPERRHSSLLLNVNNDRLDCTASHSVHNLPRENIRFYIAKLSPPSSVCACPTSSVCCLLRAGFLRGVLFGYVSSETSVNSHRDTLRYISENRILHNHSYENLKSYREARMVPQVIPRNWKETEVHLLGNGSVNTFRGLRSRQCDLHCLVAVSHR